MTAICLKVVVPTDRLNGFCLECTLKDLSNDIWHAYQSGKIVGGEEKNLPRHTVATLGGGINTVNLTNELLKKKIINLSSS